MSGFSLAERPALSYGPTTRPRAVFAQANLPDRTGGKEHAPPLDYASGSARKASAAPVMAAKSGL